jgi:hypothetical protein
MLSRCVIGERRTGYVETVEFHDVLNNNVEPEKEEYSRLKLDGRQICEFGTEDENQDDNFEESKIGGYELKGRIGTIRTMIETPEGISELDGIPATEE